MLWTFALPKASSDERQTGRVSVHRAEAAAHSGPRACLPPSRTSPAGALALLAPRQLGRSRLERIQQQECVLRGLVHVAKGPAAHVPVQRRGEAGRRHLPPLRFPRMRLRTRSGAVPRGTAHSGWSAALGLGQLGLSVEAAENSK